MKINVTNILLGLLLVILIWQNFSDSEPVEPQPITITLPETQGSSGVQVVEKYVPYPVYNNQTNEKYNVDAEWKRKYEEAKDSLEKQQLYLESIKINKYEETLVNNDTIEIKGSATTRGSLLDFNVDYRIKPSTFSYTPEIITQRPKLSMGVSVEGGIPTRVGSNFLMKGNIYIENRKGSGVNLGYDTENRIWVGVKKTFKIVK